MVYILSNVPKRPVLSLTILNEDVAILVICTIPFDWAGRFRDVLSVVFGSEIAGSWDNDIGKLVSVRNKIIPNTEQIR